MLLPPHQIRSGFALLSLYSVALLNAVPELPLIRPSVRLAVFSRYFSQLSTCVVMQFEPMASSPLSSDRPMEGWTE